MSSRLLSSHFFFSAPQKRREMRRRHDRNPKGMEEHGDGHIFCLDRGCGLQLA